MTQPLDIFADVRYLLQILILTAVEDGVVDYNTVDSIVIVGGQDMLFKVFAIHFAELKIEATGPLSAYARTGSRRRGKGKVDVGTNTLTFLYTSAPSNPRTCALRDLYLQETRPRGEVC